MKFTEALKKGDMVALKIAEKTDYHNHIDLGGNWKYLKEEGININIPLRYDGIDGMNKVIKEIGSVFEGPEGMRKRWRAALSQAADDGVSVLVPSFGKCLRNTFGSFDAGIRAFQEIVDESKTKIEIYPEITIKRGGSIYDTESMFEEALETGFFNSVDLIGDETTPPDDYINIYKKAGKYGLTKRAHIGEWSGAEGMNAYIKKLDLDEINHGIAAVNSDYTMELIMDRGICLHVCPASNIRLGYCKGYEMHPIRQLVEKNIDVTINTDDYLLFGESVTDQYYELYKSGSLGADELDKIRMCGIRLGKKYSAKKKDNCSNR